MANVAAGLETDKKLQADVAKKLNADVKFTITGKEKEVWVLRGKKGAAMKLAPEGADEAPCDADITLSGANLVKIASGKTSAQRLYMGGKLKVKGNVMKVAYVEGLLRSKVSPKL